MPYVPSEKTDGKAQDRILIDKAVRNLAEEVATKITDNVSVVRLYVDAFQSVGNRLLDLTTDAEVGPAVSKAEELADVIFGEPVAGKYNYQGAFLGELNYSQTMFIQLVPDIMVEREIWKSALRYWLYAETVEALILASKYFLEKTPVGIAGVFEDIKDEYKRRVNVSYEAAQIIKSGDCYIAPYQTVLTEVVNEEGEVLGHQEIMVTRPKLLELTDGKPKDVVFQVKAKLVNKDK